MKTLTIPTQAFRFEPKRQALPARLSPEEGERGIEITPPEGWHAYRYLVVEARAEAEKQPYVRLFFQVNADTAMAQTYRILPGCVIRIPFPIDEDALMAESAFLPARPGLLKGTVQGGPTRGGAVTSLRLTARGEDLTGFTLYGAYFSQELPDGTVEAEPVVDAFGQYKGRNWEGKTGGEAELIAYLQKEHRRAQTGNAFPAGWSRYGGWLEKRFDATGWFHTAFDGRRWWLVDPEGYAFFSNGMCYGTRTGIYGLTDHLEALHDWLPEKDGPFRDAWATGEQIPQYVVRNGREDAKGRRLFNFARANMIRAFGEGWREAWIDINAARLRRWGFNTVGVGVNEYEDEHTRAALARAGIPYVWTFRFFPLTRQRVFRDFPDVFSEEYAEACRAFARRELLPLRDDPLLIGYFVTNEPEWFFAGANLAERMLASGKQLASKRVFADKMQKKYGDIAALNAAWKAELEGFEALLRPQTGLMDATPASAADFAAFHDDMVEAYGRIVSEALREVDPNHLNLGMRYSQGECPLRAKPAYFDVFSFNCYGSEPRGTADRTAERYDMPMIVGEWHVGARESGLNAWGLYYTDTQAQRGQAIEYYLEQATQSRALVGVHYFEYCDQPLLGRFDGECYNIGLIDVCGRPYAEVASACERFAGRMYPLAAGQAAPDRPAAILHKL